MHQARTSPSFFLNIAPGAAFQQWPQVILVINEEIVYTESHGMIDADQIQQLLV